MNDAPPSVITAGYVPLDIILYRGRTWHAAGGTAGNVAAILGFLGWNASVIADVGDDLAGRRIRSDLQKSNVSVDYLRTVGSLDTPRVVHNITEEGHSYRFKCPKCSRSLPSSRPLSLKRAIEIHETAEVAPNVFFFDRINAGTLDLAEAFKDNGSTIYLEPSREARPTFTRRALEIADIVKVADDRIGELRTTTASKPRQLWIITAGFKGAKFRFGNGKWHESPAYSYPVVDAGGAGDWTSAGLINSFQAHPELNVRTVSSSLTWAQALAAVSCGVPGARGLARRQTADSVIKAAQFLQANGTNDSSMSVGSGRKQIPKMGAPNFTCSSCLQPEITFEEQSVSRIEASCS